MKSAQEIYDQGRPNRGFALTHEPTRGTLHDLAGRVPLGVVRKEEIVRDYTWKPFTAHVRVAVGTAKERFRNRPDLQIPAILAEALESFGGQPPALEELAALPYHNVTFLMLDRLTDQMDGRIPIAAGWLCVHCHKPVGDLYRDEAEAEWFDWSAGSPPRAVVWLDHPLDYEGQVEALVVQAVPWRKVYQGLTTEQAASADIETARLATCGVVGYVRDGEVRLMPVDARIVERKLHGGADTTRMSLASIACGGQAARGAMVTHTACNRETPVPFDFLTGQ